MQDLIIATLIVGGTLYSLKQPWVGAIVWTWVSLMSPHTEFGWRLQAYPVATGVALCTMIGLAIAKDRQNPLIGAPMKWTLAFTIWICITLPFSFYFQESLGLWERSMKIFLMLFVTAALITDRRKLHVFIWIIVISLGFYGVKGGAFTILNAGNYRIWGPGGFIGGNNELALALICTIPLMRYLQTQTSNRYGQLAFTAAMGLTAIAALGTYSRGAFLGVAAMGAFFWWRSKQKVLWGVLVLLMGAVALSMMPQQWWDRMDTIKEYDEDISAMGRISAWWMAFNVAKAHFFGGGFMIYELAVAQQYSPDVNKARAAHSIYFQVLGEHGFVGLFIFLGIGVATWLTARRLIKHAEASAEFAWAGELGRMVQVSMIGYAVTGAFLSLSYFDLPYNIALVAAVALKIVRKSIDEQAAAKASAARVLQPITPPRTKPAGPMPPHRPMPPARRP